MPRDIGWPINASKYELDEFWTYFLFLPF